MPEYPPGTPSWVDLASPDPDASAAFYGELLGWDATTPDTQAGGYRRFQQEGKDVAGLAPQMQQEQPTAWATYVSVADADEIAGRVQAAGGSVIVGPMDVMDIGRLAVFADPSGAVLGVWQPKTFAGAEIVNEPNSLCWNEVYTRDSEADKRFYSEVFGWSAGRPSFPNAPESYTLWELGDRVVGGMMEMNDEFPPDMPPHWRVCFAVSDTDGVVAKARELGATIVMEPMDMPIGRFAALVDPQGASFTVMQMAQSG